MRIEGARSSKLMIFFFVIATIHDRKLLDRNIGSLGHKISIYAYLQKKPVIDLGE